MTACAGSIAQAYVRKTSFRLAHTQAYPAAGLYRRYVLSPIDALIDLVVWCRLPRQIPVWIDLDTLTRLRITVLPHRRTARLGYAWRLRLHPDMIEYLQVQRKIF